MSKTLRPTGSRTGARAVFLVLCAPILSLAGCASVSEDVDAYYRQMAYNYREAEEKAKSDVVTLENESKVLATTGDYNKLKRAQRKLNRIKDWEEKCDKEARRFEKAAEWTEAHFRLQKPPIPDRPPGSQPVEDEAVLQASGAKDP